jgi:hypothetical protein
MEIPTNKIETAVKEVNHASNNEGNNW